MQLETGSEIFTYWDITMLTKPEKMTAFLLAVVEQS